MSAEPVPTQPVFRPSPDIFAGELDGMLVVLDLRSEAYYILDEVATTMWRLLVERGERAAVLAELSARYDADAALLARDLDALIARLIEGGFGSWGRPAPAPTLFPAAPEPARGTGAIRPRTARAWWWLARTVWSLRRAGFAATYRRSVALAALPAVPAAAAAEVLERALRAFARAENLFVIRAAPRDCFPRSIALFCFLRELGVPVEHRIGVNRYPFRAHAWVTHGERVLADRPDGVRVFTTVARLPA